MKTTKLVLGLLAFLATATSFGANPTAYGTGELLGNAEAHYIHGQPIKFGYWVTECTDVNLRERAKRFKLFSRSAKWDDRWYYIKVPVGQCLVFGWYDMNARKYGFAAAENAPNTWHIRSNSTNWFSIGNGQKHKFTFKLHGVQVALDIMNPENKTAGMGDFVFFSWGY